MKMVSLGSLMADQVPSLDPSKYPNEVFELWSIPAFEGGQPEITEGSNIGSSKKCVEPNDVLLSRIVPHIRRTWVVSKSDNGLRQLASGEWIVFRSNKFYPNYLRYALISDDFHARFMQTVAGVGGSLLRARPEGVKRIEIPLPPIEEQRRIAAILDKADGVRRKRKEAIRLTEELLRSAFLEMFGDPVTNPKGWEVNKLSTAFVSNGNGTCCGPFGSALKKHEYVESGIPVWGIDNVLLNKFSDKGSLFINAEKFSTLRRYSVQEGDILISRAGTVGRMCVYEKNETSIIGSNLIRLRLNPEMLHPLLFTSMYSFLSDRLEGLRTSGDEKSYSFLNTTKLSNLNVYFPHHEEQRAFIVLFKHVRELQEEKVGKQEREIDDLFNSLLQRAFRGEL